MLNIIVISEGDSQYKEYIAIGSTTYTLTDGQIISIHRSQTPDNINTIIINNSAQTIHYDQIIYISGISSPLDIMLDKLQKDTEIIAPFEVFHSPHKDIYTFIEPSSTISSETALERGGWIHNP